MSSNCLVFHTFGGISSSPAASLFLIFLRTKSSSSLVNGPSLMSNCLLIILVIGSFVTFGGFPCRFSKCYFHSFILSCWFAAFNFSLAVLFLLLTSFIVCQAIPDCLSSTDSLILSIWFCMYSVCSFRYIPAHTNAHTRTHTHTHLRKRLLQNPTSFWQYFSIFGSFHFVNCLMIVVL